MKLQILFAALLFAALQAKAQKPEPTPVQVEKAVAVTKQLNKQVQNDASYLKVLDILTDYEVTVNLASGKLYRTDDKNLMIKYLLTDKAGRCDYKSIVYVSEDGKAFCYFEDKRKGPVPVEAQQKGIFCSWSNWTNSFAGTECHHNVWCKKIDNPGQGPARPCTYKWETRGKTCNNVVKKVVSRLVKVQCGC